MMGLENIFSGELLSFQGIFSAAPNSTRFRISTIHLNQQTGDVQHLKIPWQIHVYGIFNCIYGQFLW